MGGAVALTNCRKGILNKKKLKIRSYYQNMQSVLIRSLFMYFRSYEDMEIPQMNLTKMKVTTTHCLHHGLR